VQTEDEMMGTSLLLMVVAVALTTMTPALHAAGLVVKPDKGDEDYEPLDLSHINPVDLCLFICHSCFQEVRLNQTICSAFHCLRDTMQCTWRLNEMYRNGVRGELPLFRCLTPTAPNET